jgi:hypothetical protein
MTELGRRWQLERWISWVRLGAVPWAVVEVGVISQDYPAGHELGAWLTTAALAVGAAAFFFVDRRPFGERGQRLVCLASLSFNTLVIWAYCFVFAFEPGTPIRQLLYFAVIEAALRYGLVGGAMMPLAQLPVLVGTELLRADRFAPPEFTTDHITFPLGLQFLMGLIVGWLVKRLARETELAEQRAGEAEGLRDELGRRVDVLDAANRCARALGSSLDLDQAFAAFIRELRGLLGFDRTAIVLADDGTARVMAAAGAGADTVFPIGTRRDVAGSILEDVLTARNPSTGGTCRKRHTRKSGHSTSSACAAASLPRSS